MSRNCNMNVSAHISSKGHMILPHGIVNFSTGSLGVFKHSIQLVDFSQFLKCY